MIMSCFPYLAGFDSSTGFFFHKLDQDPAAFLLASCSFCAQGCGPLQSHLILQCNVFLNSRPLIMTLIMTTMRHLGIHFPSRWNFQIGWWRHLELGPRLVPMWTTASLTSVPRHLQFFFLCSCIFWHSKQMGINRSCVYPSVSLQIWGLDYHILAGAIFGLALFFTGIFGWEGSHQAS